MKKTYISNSPEETQKIAEANANLALERKVVCLVGGLGAGKTAFARGLVAALCPECLPLVHSPTFAIVNEYIGKKHPVFHFDLYRIKSAEDLYSTGFYDYEDRDGVIVAEWSDLFPECFPENALTAEIITEGENKRIITITYKD